MRDERERSKKKGWGMKLAYCLYLPIAALGCFLLVNAIYHSINGRTRQHLQDERRAWEAHPPATRADELKHIDFERRYRDEFGESP